MCCRLLQILHLLAHLLDQHLHLDRGACGLEILGLRGQGVGLAVELLHQEIQAPARRLGAAQRAARLLDVTDQSVELLVDVQPLQQQQHFLSDALLVDLGAELAQPLLEALPDARLDCRSTRTDGAYHRGEGRTALLDQCRESRTLALAGELEFRQGRGKQLPACRGQQLGVGVIAAHDAGPAQQLDQIDARQFRKSGAQLGDAGKQPGQRIPVDVEFTAAAGRRPLLQRAVDFPTFQRRRQRLAQLRLEGAAAIGQAQRGVEKAVIDTADLANQGPETSGALAPREPRHACDHGRLMVYKARRSVAENAGARLRVEHAELSLQGARDSNQDRVGVSVVDEAALLIACDGMGGHADGERAADLAQRTVLDRFSQYALSQLDPLGFLHLALGAAHEGVATLGAPLPLELRPRATCAICLVQENSAYWAHVGDSRVYHLRAGRIRERTRDHSHVELLVREGLISAGQVQGHPMRNFVESCLGGEPILPEMAITARRTLLPGDVLLVCTDGFWANLDEEVIGSAFVTLGLSLHETLEALSAQALVTAGGASDNTSVAALRFLD